MKKTLFFGFMLASLCIPAQIIVNESFEGVSLPSGFSSFHNSTLSGTRTPSFGTFSGTPCLGGRAVSMNLYGRAITNSWYLVYSSNNSNGSDLSYSFQYLAKPYENTQRVEGSFEVEYSVDNGVSWNSLVSPTTISEAHGVSIPCTSVSGTIPGSEIPVGSSFKIRIHSVGEASADYYMGIDNFRLEQAVSGRPSCTTITAPADGSTVNSIVPTIVYGSVPEVAEYKISLGTTPGGTDILNNVSNGQLLQYPVPASAGLQFNTQYYVTVTPSNSAGDANGCQSISFNTGMPSCPSGNVVAINGNEATLSWEAVQGALGYRVSMGSTPGGSDILDNHDVGNVLSYTPSVTLTSATTYYYTVNSYAGSYTSQGCTENTFVSNPPPPVNDACSTALVVNNFPYSYRQIDAAGTTNNAGVISVCNTGMNDGVWYKFVGDGNQHTVSVTDVTPRFDPKLQVYSGDCSSLVCIVSRDTGMGGQNESVTFATVAGTEYYVNVGHYSGFQDFPEAPFTINITRNILSTSEVSNDRKKVTFTPNPFVDEVQFYGVDVVYVSVIDAVGRTVKMVEVNKNIVNLADLKAGMYVFLLQHKDGTTSTVKAIKR